MLPIQVRLFNRIFSIFAYQAILAVYLLLSFVFAFERILNTDNSMYLFQLINTKTFVFPESRFGVFISELPVLGAIWLGIGLRAVIFIYSLSFPLLYCFISWICVKRLGQKDAGLIIALLLVSGVGYTFFHPVTEIHQAMVYAMLVFALLNAEASGKISGVGFYISITVAVALCLLAHPAALFLLMFIAVFRVITRKSGLKSAVILFITCLLTGLIRVFSASETSYDAAQYQHLFHASDALANLFSLQPLLFLATRSITTYLSVLTSVVFGFILAFRLPDPVSQRKRLVWAFGLLAAGFLALISVLTFSQGDSDMMLEKSFIPAVFVVIITFVYLLKDAPTSSPIFIYLPFVIAIIGFTRICYVGNKVSKRLYLLDEIAAANQDQPKLIAAFSDFDAPEMTLNHWATASDMLMLSLVKQKKPVTLYITELPDTFSTASTDARVFLCVKYWQNWDAGLLNPDYFKLPAVPYMRYKSNRRQE